LSPLRPFALSPSRFFPLSQGWLIAAALGAALILFHSDILFGNRSYFLWDLAYQFFPWRSLAGESLAEGILPLWNPFVFCGISQIGNVQAALLYPPTWLFIWPNFPAALATHQILHQALTCWGLYRLSRYLGVTPQGSAFAALTWGFSGALAIRLPFINMSAVLGWLPWALLAGLRLRDKGRTRDTVLLGAILSLAFLAGQPREFLLLVFSTLGAVLWPGPRGTRFPVRGLGLFLMASGLGAALSLAQGLPFLEAFGFSVRSGGLSSEEALIGGWDWSDLWHWILPLVYGTVFAGPYDGPEQSWSGYGYIGIWGLVFAFRGWLGLSRRTQWISALLFLIYLGMAFGGGGVVWKALRLLVPILSWVRYPESTAVIVVLAMSVAAGRGWDQGPLLRVWPSKRGAILWACLGTAILIGCGPLINRGIRSGGGERLRANLIRVGGLLALGASGPPAVVVAQFIDFLDLRRRISPSVDDSLFEVVPPEIRAAVAMTQGRRLYLSPAALAGNENLGIIFEEAVLLMRRRLLPVIATADHISLAGGYDPLEPQRFHDYWVKIHLEGSQPWDHKDFPLMAAPVGAFVPEPRVWQQLQISFKPLPAWPRAWVSDHRPAKASRNDGYPIPEIPGGGSLAFAEDGWGRTHISIEKAPEGWLFISKGYNPGLRATVDGQERKLGVAGGAFCGLSLHKGDTEIRIHYEPGTFFVGFFVSCLALAGLAALVVRGGLVLLGTPRSKGSW